MEMNVSSLTDVCKNPIEDPSDHSQHVQLSDRYYHAEFKRSVVKWKYHLQCFRCNFKVSRTDYQKNQQTRELISARKTSHKYNNKDLSRLP